VLGNTYSFTLANNQIPRMNCALNPYTPSMKEETVGTDKSEKTHGSTQRQFNR